MSNAKPYTEQDFAESPEDMHSRLMGMCLGEPTWGLSDNDKMAIWWAVSTLDTERARAEEAERERDEVRAAVAMLPPWFNYRNEDWREAIESVKAKLRENAALIVDLGHARSRAESRAEAALALLGECHALLLEHHAANDCCRIGGHPCAQCEEAGAAQYGGLFYRISALFAQNKSLEDSDDAPSE